MERLNKFLAHAGVGSRRYCDELIAAGRVSIDQSCVRDLGLKVDPATQKIYVDGERIKPEKLVYWLVNKPRGYLCTNHDPDGRPRAVDLVPQVEQRVYPVGRLDEASEGLLLLTNDGELAHRLMHPRFGVEKVYQVQIAGLPKDSDLAQLEEGIWLAEGKVRASQVRRLKTQGNSTWLRIVLREGKNREIRRMLARSGHKVLKLKRIAIGPLRLHGLPTGKARRLTGPEIKLLRQACAHASRAAAPADADDPADAPPRASRANAATRSTRAARPGRPAPRPSRPDRPDRPGPTAGPSPKPGRPPRPMPKASSRPSSSAKPKRRGRGGTDHD